MVAAVLMTGCLAVGAGADRITLGDLAPAFGAPFAAAAETAVAFAPEPGVRRVFRPAELARIASRYGERAAPEREICFERPLARPDAGAVLAAMKISLPDAAIELVEQSRNPAPEGRLEFPLSGLRRGAGGGLWMGTVRYGLNRRFPVWARVRIRLRSMRVVAAADLKAGEAPAAAQLRLEESDELADSPLAASIEEAAGRVLRRTVRAGTAIRRAWLEPARDVNRGDTVRVEVRSGAARLVTEARAEGSGSASQMVLVRNPLSKKCFRARVEGKGRVSVEP
jgi:flagella basal body P-ring formation protein FlgA